MPTLTSREAFIQYIKEELGSPVINVEVADVQINNIIDDSVQDFQRYNYGEGSYLDYQIFTCEAGVSAYSLSGNNISEIVEIYVPNGAYGINTLFSPEHILLQERGNGPGTGPGTNFGNRGSSVGLELGEYDIMMQTLEEYKLHFSTMYSTDYNPMTELLRIFPTPKETLSCLLTVYRKEQFLNLINNSLVKKLAVARTKKRMAFNIGKYNVQLPGGGTINASDIMNQGIEEERFILEQIKSESEPVDFYIF